MQKPPATRPGWRKTFPEIAYLYRFVRCRIAKSPGHRVNNGSFRGRETVESRQGFCVVNSRVETIVSCERRSFRSPNVSRELPSCCRIKEIAISRTYVVRRCNARSSPQNHLTGHEFALVFGGGTRERAYRVMDERMTRNFLSGIFLTERDVITVEEAMELFAEGFVVREKRSQHERLEEPCGISLMPFDRAEPSTRGGPGNYVTEWVDVRF